MLDIFLQILSVIGILLLVIGLVLLTVVLLVLFYPVTYQVSGRKTPEELTVKARVNWLFGCLRVRYAYPEPGKVTVKFLWFTLYEMGEDTASDRETDGKKAGEKRKQVSSLTDDAVTEKSDAKNCPDAAQESSAESSSAGQEPDKKETEQEKDGQERTEQEETEQGGSWISKKIAKIKYTIRSIYDKIIRIWQNISYYVELWNEENTRQLLSHVMLRVRKILKSLRPRKLRADILFGTGAPDTTGYAFGVYGMLMPLLGPEVVVTPDFQRAVFQGSFQASGFMTLFELLRQVLLVVLDKRLKQFLKKLKKPGAEPEGNTVTKVSKKSSDQKNKKHRK